MIAFALLFAVATPAQPAIDELLQRHAIALGGEAAIASIHSFVTHGWYQEGSFRIDGTYVAQMRPFYRVIGSPKDPLGEIHEGYDGSAWEYYPDPGIVVRTIGQAARTTRHTALFDDPLVQPQQRGITLRLRGEETFYGHPVYVIHTRLADGYEEDYFLDSSSYLIDGRAEVVPMHAFGKRYRTQDVYDDYRPEGGVMFHHRDREIDASTGTVLDQGGVTSVDINPNLPVSMFSPPTWTRTPLQEMIQRLYDERDETASVMATYRDFGAVVDLKAAATGDAVDFTGYQILKMGHPETAVALLRQNVTDHPNSARAHFGLGRALVVAGDKAAAKEQFELALRIDPKYDRAQKALSDLP
ncbi:MAG TPA: tetratricopeptide repeat protein [Candidatus Baltobacteraceae bacterium]|nr:tetratricopeptide repeat protein [Candidatus Baltobacteraceae bacterium]